jgi:Zn-dependent protease
MARDPRADILEDDLFPKPAQKIHRVHTQQSSDGTIHFDMKKGAFGMNNRQPIQLHKGKIWHFSKEERHHLLLATAAFTLALGLMRVGGVFGVDAYGGTSTWAAVLLLSMPVMLLAVGPAFLLHEIGHKIVAKKYGCWAEFRADPKGLKFGVGIAAILGIVLMAPGAVMVAGLVTRRQNGHIAIAGPAVNFGLFLIGIPLGGILLGLTGAEDFAVIDGEYLVGGAINLKAMVGGIVFWWIFANLGLGFLNMIPFGPLDGAKIKDWNEPVWFATFGIFIVTIYLWWSGIFSPIELAISIAELF